MTTTSMTDRLLHPSEVSVMLGLSIYTITRFCREGKIQGVKMPSGRWRISESAIHQFCTRNGLIHEGGE